MNLIEQLGGYEAAKAFLNATSYTMDELIMMQRSGVRPQHVEKALLEYRRQHNIFEVGDKVVVKAHPFWPEDYVIHTVEQEHIGKWYMSAWRHAEPEELEAGKRLEVNDGN
ncbi:hypothetical protein [Acinetobacter sp. YH12086]|uniref:hypothetical protein n=1 Tax=Acinetobacter sp. YH12086 TaxID=2601078 RepID=UPI0015D15740|nr:hypothetical protein [Acinetobacter sp. YH12086]